MCRTYYFLSGNGSSSSSIHHSNSLTGSKSKGLDQHLPTVPHLHTPGATGHPLPLVMTTKDAPRHCQMSLGTKSPSSENRWELYTRCGPGRAGEAPTLSPEAPSLTLHLPALPRGALTQPDVSLKGHQHVAGLQVPVDDSLAVQEAESFQHLAANHLNLGLGETSVQLWKHREPWSVQHALTAGSSVWGPHQVQGTISTPSYRWGDRGSERPGHLFKVTQVGSHRSEIQTSQSCPRSSGSQTNPFREAEIIL